MKRLLLSLLCAAGLIGGLASPAAADEVVIKIGTLAPNGSTWHTLMKEMAQKWQDATGGQVKLRIYPGGVLGNEGEQVKKMRINQLQAAALTTIGLHEIAPDPQGVDVPGLVDSWKTLDYVMQRMGPKLEKKLEDKGFVVLSWSEVGFVRFFSTKKFSSIPELLKAKVFCWEGDPASAEAWKIAGFSPVVMASTDIVPSLQTGILDTVGLAPLYAYQSQIFQKAKYMIDVPWSVLTGAMVVRKDAWEKIPADQRAKLLAISQEYGKRISAEVRKLDEDALKNMKAQGLEVVKPVDAANFTALAQSTYKIVRGKIIPEATFDEVQRLVKEAHAQK